MESEAGSFETSEMLGTFLGSTPLPKGAWRVCSTANAMGCGAFVVEQVGGVGYVAFSAVQDLPVLDWDPNYGVLVSLDAAGHGLFAPLKCRHDGEEPVMVHHGVLQLFLRHHSRLDFQSQICNLLGKTKSIVITGHSIGGSVAFLAALWVLSYLKSIFPPRSILCIGFGSPFLGNESLYRAILRERLDGSFCNIVSTHDIMPMLSLYRSLTLTPPQWQDLMRFCYMSSNFMNFANFQLTEEEKAWLFSFDAATMEHLVHAGEGSGGRSFCPSGNYLFCSDEGAICLDNAVSVNKMMHLMLRPGSPNCIVEEHLKYGWYVERLTRQPLKRSFMEGDLSESSYEASLSMALNSLGISQQVSVAPRARDCLKIAKQMGGTPNLNAANLAIGLSKIAPYRAEIEWYKVCCDESNEQRGYYDSFKQRGASQRESKINTNRFKLAAFWDKVVCMLDRNELPLNFHRSLEGVIEESLLYLLLVEPLDIAEYYRSGMHLEKGHYISNGRPRRYEIFAEWWAERVAGEELGNTRIRYADLTQDTCFWARVEEAKEWLDKFKNESDPTYLARLNEFETYAMKLVVGKKVSADVVAKNSSFSLWLEEWRSLKPQIPYEHQLYINRTEGYTIDAAGSSPPGQEGAVPFRFGSSASMAMEETHLLEIRRIDTSMATGLVGEAEIPVVMEKPLRMTATEHKAERERAEGGATAGCGSGET